jgi:hypothetical protein
LSNILLQRKWGIETGDFILLQYKWYFNLSDFNISGVSCIKRIAAAMEIEQKPFFERKIRWLPTSAAVFVAKQSD